MKTPPRPAGEDVLIQERVIQTLRLRRDGYQFREIGQALGVSVSTAHSYYKQGMAQARETTEEEAENLRLLENDRLDAAQRTLMAQINACNKQAADCDAKKDFKGAEKARASALQFIDRLVALSARRSALNGLDKARKIGLDISDDELIAKARRELAKYGVALDAVLGEAGDEGAAGLLGSETGG